MEKLLSNLNQVKHILDILKGDIKLHLIMHVLLWVSIVTDLLSTSEHLLLKDYTRLVKKASSDLTILWAVSSRQYQNHFLSEVGEQADVICEDYFNTF